MYLVRKKHQPPEFADYKAKLKGKDKTRDWVWDDLEKDVKQAVRQSLLEEQRFVCCYCNVAIGLSNALDVRIEHWAPQKSNPELRLRWNNLLAACTGGGHSTDPHCDRRKGETSITLSPLKRNHVDKISYSPISGKLKSSSDVMQSEIDKTLGLNIEKLMMARRDKFFLYRERWGILRERLGEHRYREELARKVNDLIQDSPAEPFGDILHWYLARKTWT